MRGGSFFCNFLDGCCRSFNSVRLWFLFLFCFCLTPGLLAKLLFFQDLDRREVTFRHNFAVYKFPQNDLSVSASWNYPLHMGALCSKHLWRELIFEQRVYHISMVSENRYNHLSVHIMYLNVWLLLQRPHGNSKMSLGDLDQTSWFYLSRQSL